ncbi:hypothetical protein CFC21_000930 [Triticum aestivum]|uniref:Uncharacterized protein n=1 Tax=Triticum aestivum TaxID=4565 RepID=A0A3B5XVP7_WHEAT|nr:hypothetical protein CFC21_000930 [Triticum aestivum]
MSKRNKTLIFFFKFEPPKPTRLIHPGSKSGKSILKTGLRNKMGDDWMNHRMVCYIERDVFVSIEESKIIERFQGYRTRKGVLPRPRRLASSAIEDVVMEGSDQPIL